jgi:hypothetical protein
MFTVSIKDEVTGLLQDAQVSLSETQINPPIAAAMVRLFQDHFAKQPENAKGWPSTHYWGDAAKGTSSELLPDGFLLRVAQPGLNMHVTGIPAVIRPVHAKNLAIPAVPAAYGKRPGEFSNLRVAFRRKGGNLEAFALVEKSAEDGERTQQVGGYRTHKLRAGMAQKRVVGKDGQTRYFSLGNPTRTKWLSHAGEVIFWLCKEVHTHKREGTIPTEDEMRHAATSVAEDEVRRLKAKHHA